MAGDGISGQSKRALLSDSDLDKNLADAVTQQQQPAEAQRADPTKQITQQEWDAKVKAGRAKRDEEYNKWKASGGGRAKSRLGVQ